MEQRDIRRKTKRKGNKCCECANAKFDELWGEYKCLVHQRRIQTPNAYTSCASFKKETAKK